MILKTIKLFVLTLTAVCAFSVPVLAVDVTGEACQGIADTAACKDSQAGKTSNPLYGPDGALTKVISVLSTVLAIIAVIVLIIAGIKYSLSGGDGAKVTTARNTIIYAAVGIVVAGVAQALVNLVLKRL